MNAASNPPEPSPRRSVASVAELCALIEEAPGGSSGELAISRGAQQCGLVLVESRRVCWAAAPGLARRLTDLLGARAGLSRLGMEAVFLRCRAEQVPLGEFLVGRGVIGSEDLREALLQHTAESLRTCLSQRVDVTFRGRPGRGYAPRFTFAASEIYAAVARLDEVSLGGRAAALLAQWFDPEDSAGAFVRGSGALPTLLAVHGEERPVSMLLGLGRWAISVLDLATAVDREASLVSTRTTAGRVGSRAVALRVDELVLAAEVSEYGAARILNRRARRRRLGGASDGLI